MKSTQQNSKDLDNDLKFPSSLASLLIKSGLFTVARSTFYSSSIIM